jgi:hypothetical protein
VFLKHEEEGIGPKLAGSLVKKGAEVVLKVSPGVTITSDGRAVTSQVLASDATGSPTKLKLDSMTFFVIDRGGKLGLRLRDAESPARRGFTGIDYDPIDGGWRVNARWEAYDPPHVLGDGALPLLPDRAISTAELRERRIAPLGPDDLIEGYGPGSR